MLKVESIQNGIVIDHITAGKGMEIYRLLDLEASGQSVALLQNVKSRKYGTKDLIKIEGTTVPSRLDILGYLDDKISLIYIQNSRQKGTSCTTKGTEKCDPVSESPLYYQY